MSGGSTYAALLSRVESKAFCLIDFSPLTDCLDSLIFQTCSLAANFLFQIIRSFSILFSLPSKWRITLCNRIFSLVYFLLFCCLALRAIKSTAMQRLHCLVIHSLFSIDVSLLSFLFPRWELFYVYEIGLAFTLLFKTRPLMFSCITSSRIFWWELIAIHQTTVHQAVWMYVCVFTYIVVVYRVWATLVWSFLPIYICSFSFSWCTFFTIITSSFSPFQVSILLWEKNTFMCRSTKFLFAIFLVPSNI